MTSTNTLNDRVTLGELLADPDKTLDMLCELKSAWAHGLWRDAVHALEDGTESPEWAEDYRTTAALLRSEGEEALAQLQDWEADIYADRTTAEAYMVAYARHQIDVLRSDLECVRFVVAPVAVRAIESALKSAQECFSHLLIQ